MQIQLSRLSLDRERRSVLTDCSLELAMGEKIGLVGPNGSGKTSLLWIILGLIHPKAGTIKIFGKQQTSERDFQEIRGDVGFLFQNSDDQLFCSTVMEDIAFGPLNKGKTAKEAHTIVDKLLARFQMSEFKHRITHHLSGGEKRLISLASVLAMEPKVLLLDEPDSDLDPVALERTTEILKALQQSMIVVSHNLSFLRTICSRIVRLEDGKLTG